MPPPRRPAPEPLDVNDVAVITVGTVLWFVALGLGLIFREQLTEAGNEDWLWIMAAGGGLGLMGILFLRRRRERNRPETAPVEAPPAGPLPPSA